MVSLDRWKGKVAVVTGASSGIGAAIAAKLVDAHLKVVGIARGKERLDNVAKTLESRGKFYTISADVTKEEDVMTAFKWIEDNVGPVHILVNSAGVGRATSLMDGSAKLWNEVIETNVIGLSIATKEALKSMRQNKIDGHVLHINSYAGHKVCNVPGLNIYPASKHAVTALTETLRLELNAIASKIKISSISPGLVKTNILNVSGEVAKGLHLYLDFVKNEPKLLPEDVADAVMFALSTPPHVQISELIIKPVGEKV